MLFYLHPSLAEIAKNTGNSSKITKLKDVIEDLMITRRRGTNVIYSDRKTFGVLINIPGLSDRTKDVMLKIKNRLTGKHSIFKNIPIYTQLRDGESIFEKITSESGQEIINISIDMLPDSNDFFSPALLAENSTDIELYKIISGAWKKSTAPSESINIKMLSIPGGGSQTSRIYQDIKKQHRLCLCIVDGDVTFENSPPGDNANQIIISDTEEPNPLTKSVIISCYSLENLIPPKVIREANELQDAVNIKWLDLLEYHASKDYWPYLTIKKTIECTSIKNNSHQAIFWRKKFNLNEINSSCAHIVTDVDKCAHTCQILVGASDKTARTVLDFLINKISNPEIYLAEKCKDFPVIFSLWAEIAKNITAWGISGSRMSATHA